MNYRHLYHAGCFSDVFKHILLIALFDAYERKESPFCYLDTHAGAGQYDLEAIVTSKQKEYMGGITKVLQAKNPPPLIARYLQYVQQLNPGADENLTRYPGSPLIAKYLARPQDRIIACELEPKAHTALKSTFGHDSQVAVHHMDGYLALKAFLPPKEKRGIVLIDPPYEKTTEFTDITDALELALKRFATGTYAVWYPIKMQTPIIRMQKKMRELTDKPILAIELSVYHEDTPSQLNGCGLVIINPPWQLDHSIQEILPWLWQVLSHEQQGTHRVFLVK